MPIASSTPSFKGDVRSNRDHIPSIMRATVYRGVNDVRMEEVPVPEIGAGEILVRVHTCGICGTDLKKIATGSHSSPRIFGHETSGVVARVGEGVSKFHIGDRVVVFHHIPCGQCFYCLHKTFAQCETYKKVGLHCRFRTVGRRICGICPGNGLDCRKRVRFAFLKASVSSRHVLSSQ